jgi:beta-galactosidase
MAEARMTSVTVGNFAWSALEPSEGRYTFDWLDRIMDRMHAAGIRVVLSTPSGARPPWLAQRYPEVLRTAADRRRNLCGGRHNHCLTSPVYRRMTAAINRQLATRYAAHPALVLWHLSNEYGGECHCELCQEAFRAWLRARYQGGLDDLNRAWWSAFWSHTYTDWSQVESPAPHGEFTLPGLSLDWRRFVTAQTVDFMVSEIAPLRAAAPRVPVTTNLMGAYSGLDYAKLAPHMDVVSWDSYPSWHEREEPGTGFISDADGRDWVVAAATGFSHDLMRGLKGGSPFLLMESTPSVTNWHPVRRLKRPGLHAVSSLQAVAHGSDSVQYFQWRRGLGGFERFHGSVVDHQGGPRGRTFEEVAEVGRILGGLPAAAAAAVPAETGILFDWESWWAIRDASLAPERGDTSYLGTCMRHHRPFWAGGIPTDVIGASADLSRYRLVVVPFLALLGAELADRLDRFVREGGTLVVTRGTAVLDEHARCFLEGAPGPLAGLLGLRVEETDELCRGDANRLVMAAGNSLGLGGEYGISGKCDLLRLEGAEVLGTYGSDFYAGSPALTARVHGRGTALYLGAGFDDAFLAGLARALCRRLGLRRALETDLPEGVTAQVRTTAQQELVFLLNFAPEPRTVACGSGMKDAVEGIAVEGALTLGGFGWKVLSRPRSR